MLKNEIIKKYNSLEENNTFLMENDQTFIDTIKLKNAFSKSKKLILEMMKNDESSDKYIIIEINPFGYINSKRKTNDGITYFGANLGEGDDIGGAIDVDIQNNENNDDDSLYGRHFMIKFNPDSLNYYIKDLGRGTGTFIKIQEWTEIKNNFLLNIGENYLILSFEDDEDDEYDNNINYKKNFYENKLENFITIKIFSLSTQIKNYKFFPSDCPITIGRSNENSIFIDDNMLSRIHCTIDYGNEKWYIQDGFARNGLREEEIKKSTNGCWIFAYEEKKIVNKMIFKSNHNLFICNLV